MIPYWLNESCTSAWSPSSMVCPSKTQTYLPFHLLHPLEEGDSCIYSAQRNSFVFTLLKEDKEHAIH